MSTTQEKLFNYIKERLSNQEAFCVLIHGPAGMMKGVLMDYIDSSLQKITGTTEDFGGCSRPIEHTDRWRNGIIDAEDF
ncbi:unnamed protein product [Caenorhabditis nigoni]